MHRSPRLDTPPSAHFLAALVAVAVLALATFITGAASAGEEQIERVIALHLDDADPVEVSFDGRLEIGESRQLFTDDGREVLLFRDDVGLHLTIDGETIDLPSVHAGDGGHQYAFIAGDDDSPHEVEIEQILGDGGDGAQVITKTIVIDGEGHNGNGAPQTFVWHGDDRPSTAEQLEASGALDDLDADERQRILDALGAIDGQRKQIEVIVMKDDEPVD